MTKVEYNADLMRTAMQRVVEIQQAMMDASTEVQLLSNVLRPGDAPETKAFHEKLITQTVPHVNRQHTNMLQELKNTIAGLAAIDREYNNGELANEFGFKKINPK